MPLSADGIPATSPELILIHPDDSVLVVRQPIRRGAKLNIEGAQIVADADIDIGHKLARNCAKAGDNVIKSGAPIGSLTAAVARGDHVHVHNLASNYLPSHMRDAGGA